MKNYAVALKRICTDYILVSAESESEAIEKAQLLQDEGNTSITLGHDGNDEEITGAELSEPDSASEREDLENNNDEVAQLKSEQTANA